MTYHGVYDKEKQRVKQELSTLPEHLKHKTYVCYFFAFYMDKSLHSNSNLMVQHVLF